MSITKESAAIATLGVSSALLFFGSTLAGTVSCQKQLGEDGSAWVLPIGYKSDAYPLMLLSAIGNLGVAAWMVKGDKDKKAIASQALPTRQSEAFNPPVRVEYESDAIAYESQQNTLDGSPLAAVRDAGLVSLIGSQGSGKTTLAAAITRERLKRGHEVRVFNHHYEFGSYKPLKIYGLGTSLEEQFGHITEGIEWFLAERERRYSIRQNKPKSEWDFLNKPITIVVDELGEYKGNVKKETMQKFLKVVVSGIRKANMYFVGISQNNTMEMFGGSEGLAKLLKDGVVSVELESQPDPKKIGGLSPTGWGNISINGGEAKRFRVPDKGELFPINQSEFDFTDLVKPPTLPAKPPQQTDIRRQLEWDFQISDGLPERNPETDPRNELKSWQGEANGQAGEAPEIVSPWGENEKKEPFIGSSDTEMKRQRVADLVQAGLTQTQIILAIWGAKPGSNKAYQQALVEFKKLTEEGK